MKEKEIEAIKSYNNKIELFDLKLQNFKDSYKAGRITQIQLISMTKDFSKRREEFIKERGLIIRNNKIKLRKRNREESTIPFCYEDEYENLKKLYAKGELTKEERIDYFKEIVKIRDNIAKKESHA